MPLKDDNIAPIRKLLKLNKFIFPHTRLDV